MVCPLGDTHQLSFLACEKYYGPEKKLKELIDSCHSNGTAVIMDIVFNHVFQPNPWLRLYYDNRKQMNLHLKVRGLMLNLHILLMLDMILIIFSISTKND